MSGRHVIGKQTLEIEVDSEARALALQPHLHALNRAQLLPAVAAVLAEFDRPGEHLRLGRIEIDLGTLAAAGFEQQLAPRLARALRDALRRALDGGDEHAAPRRLTRAQAQRELLEHYLVEGTLPFWVPREPPFSCEERVLDLAQGAPDALVSLLRRLGPQERVFARLAAQLREPALRRLACVLEPRHGELVVAYVRSLHAVQQAERLLPLGQPAFEQLVWCLAQAYLVRDPGSQFNRRSFLRSLVRGLAAREGLDYEGLLLTLQRALDHAGRRVALHASFPAVVAELVSELDTRGPAPSTIVPEDGGTQDAPPDAGELQRLGVPYARLDALRAWLRDGRLPWTAQTRDPQLDTTHLGDALPELPLPHLQALFGGTPVERRRAIARVAATLAPAQLAALLARLLPQAARDDSPFADALRAFAAQAHEPRAFFGAALLAALEGGVLDLEAWAAATLPSIEDEDGADDARTWEAAPLRARLFEALRSGEVAASHADGWLAALVERHPADTRLFLSAVARAPQLRDALVARVSPEVLERTLVAAQPQRAPTLLALREACERLPAPHRPRGADVWRALLFSAASTGQAADPAFYARVLLRIFGGSPSLAVRQALQRALDDVGDGEGTATAQLTALRDALPASGSASAPSTRADAHAGADGDDGGAWQADDAEQVLAWLLAGAAPPRQAPSDDVLVPAFETLLEAQPGRVQAFVRRHAGERRARERWVTSLSESALVRVAGLLEPRRVRALVSAAEVLAAGWSEVAPSGHPALLGRAALWSFVLEFLAETPAAERSLERLADAFCAHFASRYEEAAPAAGDGESVGARLVERAVQLARATGDARLAAVLERDRTSLAARFARRLPPPPRAPRAARRAPAHAAERASTRTALRNRSSFSLEGQSEAQPRGDALFVHNAGLVIVGAFLPQFFQSLDLLGRDDEGRLRLRDTEALTRAVHLLQFLVDGSTSTPEPRLVLNKILCGVTPAEPVGRAIEPTDEERALAERLLRSVIANWTIISNTSIAGLQETFLRREGRLESSPDGWRLTVQRKTLDVLVDQLPWSISVLLHGWMPQPLYTRW